MKRIKYSRIIIEGFQSISGRLIVDLDRVGINIVKGSNGVGKSTIFDAITWAEFGVTSKKNVATWEDKRPDTYKGTRVILERIIGDEVFRIVRHLGFKGTTSGLKGGDKLMILKKPITKAKFDDSDMIGDGLYKKDMQDLINAQLGVNYTAFSNSILFGQRMKRLIESDNKDKRGLFEELFEVLFVEEAKNTAKDKMQEAEIRKRNADLSKEKSLDKVEVKQEKLDDYEERLKDFNINKDERVKTAKSDLSTSKQALAKDEQEHKVFTADLAKYSTEEVEKLTKDVDVIEADKEHSESAYRTLQSSIKKAKKMCTDYVDDISTQDETILLCENGVKEVKTDCAVCGAPVKKEDLKKVTDNLKAKVVTENEVLKVLKATKKRADTALVNLEKQIPTYDKKILDLSDKLALKETELATAKEKIKGMDNTKTRLIKLDTSMSIHRSAVKTKEVTLKREEAVKEPRLDTAEIKAEIVDLNKVAGEQDIISQEAIKLIEQLDWWIKKGYGSAGLKAFVFNAMLSTLNEYCFKYSQKLGFRVHFAIDMTKAAKPFTTDIYVGDEIRDYEDLSGGEGQRVDICTAFAMYDLITSKVEFNILVLDEVFEGLDIEGIDTAFEIIRSKADSTSIYLVTHSEYIDAMNCKTLSVGKGDNGATAILD